MDKALGIALRTAIAGVILGLIGGVIGGIDLSTIVLRMIFSGVFAGILGAGGYVVVKKYLPELLSELSMGSDDGMDSGLGGDLSVETGGNVNIVVDDEGGSHETGRSGQVSGDQADPLRQAVDRVNGEGSGAGKNDAADDLDVNTLEHEFRQEASSPAKGGKRSEEGNIFTDDEDSMVEEVHEDGSGYSAASSDIDEEEFAGAVDSLPDIGQMNDAFNHGSFSDEEETPPGEEISDSEFGAPLSGHSGTGGSQAAGEDGNDPKLIAQAISTMLKKE
ncbi:hypothetical protein [Salinispira pacifica]|uniref:Uncharacterized protein n=1 Tax=Salinispira pacifica TaxID=1307761 RepID=V5WGD1_9SPIO|nr:hypothetical protein [Salinispira pacifica]AHC14604.1 hypothetical protein L21SP2_1203 [Salinispira pacifica]